MQRIASACGTGQSCRARVERDRRQQVERARPRPATPRSSGAPPARDRSAARAVSGKSRAKWRTCSPVPLATSSTRPRSGSTSRSTSAIGPALRATWGAERRSVASFAPRQPGACLRPVVAPEEQADRDRQRRIEHRRPLRRSGVIETRIETMPVADRISQMTRSPRAPRAVPRAGGRACAARRRTGPPVVNAIATKPVP